MDWVNIGKRIRTQREYLGFTREMLAEKIDVTPKFCSDIELGVKGMSVQTLCRLSEVLNLSADYILFGKNDGGCFSPLSLLIDQCPPEKMPHLENIIKSFMFAIDSSIYTNE